MSETASRLGLPRSDFSEADVGAPTPTRFLLECGEYKLTPSLSALGELNPFEASFTSLSGKKELASTFNASNRNLAVDNVVSAPTTTIPPTSTELSSSVSELTSTPQTANVITTSAINTQPSEIPPTIESSEPASETLKTSPKIKEEGTQDRDSSSDDSQNNKHEKSGGYKRKVSDNAGNDEEKRRRFLERNRVAASKCRQKKKMWVKELEQKSEEITARNKELQQLVSQLKEELLQLKSQLLGHRNCNCNVIQQYVQTSGHFSQIPLDVNGAGVRVAGTPMAIPVPQSSVIPSQPSYSNVPPMGSMVGLPPFVNN